MANLANEVARFKKWVKNNEHTSAEWEFYYQGIIFPSQEKNLPLSSISRLSITSTS